LTKEFDLPDLMNEREIMRTTKHFITMLFCLLLCAPMALARQAQDKQSETQSANPISQDVMIIIQQEKVRFTAQKAVQEMRLQILDQSGAVVYDSGSVTEPVLNWPLQDAGGVQVKSGLYAYTLTIQEEGAGATRVRRGHFIVDRAKDRDGQNDRLWVTSQNDAGIGSDLTVARSENDTVAGVSIASEQTPTPESAAKQTTPGLAAGTAAKSDTNALTPAMPAGANGTVGYLAKFTTATDLGNSSVTEQNGNVGIGTANPLTRLSVQTATANYGFTHTDGNVVVGTWVGAGSAGTPSGWFGTMSNHPLQFFAANKGASITIATTGNVGIGTTNLTSSRLTIEGQDALSVRGYQPFINFIDTNSGNSRGAIQQVAGGLNLFTNSYLIGANPFAYLRLDNSGNVGIGSANPQAKLEVASGSGDLFRLIGYEPFITFYDSNHGYASGAIQQVGGGLNLFTDSYLKGVNPLAYLRLDNNGNVGIGTPTPEPAAKLHVAGSFLRVDGAANEQAYIGGDGIGNDVNLGSSNPSVTDVVLWNRATSKYMNLVTGALTIKGGSDFSENFDVNAAEATREAVRTKVEAGLVVSIDPTNPGKLQLSTQAYDRRVAGIISGAGGVNPGMMMSQPGTLADGQHPVALTGRVYCWADASQGAIEPGDLLTTSFTPGHAMKVTELAKAQGAIIGKAMTGLKEGKGLVLVLVTLQ
jgi:hypothetical protein